MGGEGKGKKRKERHRTGGSNLGNGQRLTLDNAATLVRCQLPHVRLWPEAGAVSFASQIKVG